MARGDGPAIAAARQRGQTRSPFGPYAKIFWAANVSLFLAAWLGSLLFPQLAVGEPASSLPETLEDAELTDIFFIDADRGWCVGDRGVIWSTEDGGRHWHLQDSPLNCRLEAVHFVDGNRGWAVGGWSQPFLHKSAGVVLRTENGGRRWTVLPTPTLPGLKDVHFLDARRGWAVGNASAMYGSGVYRTEDGGRSWSAVPGVQPQGWLATGCTSADAVAVAGYGGCGEATSQGLRESRLSPSTWHVLRGIQMTGTLGWVVGDGGTVLSTRDGGQSWQLPPGVLPVGLAEHFDWRCVAAYGEKCWIGGTPGTRVLYTGDRGRSWELQSTNQTLPLRRLVFLDGQRGWAAGSLGTILATRDGGTTWQRQKGGRTRAALLAVCSEASQAPLELLARLCGDDGYIGVTEIVSHRELETPVPAESSWEERAHAAVVAAGGSLAQTTWRFPLRQRGLGLPLETTLHGWELVNGREAAPLLEEHLASRIRQWRADVLVVGNVPAGEPALAEYFVNAVRNAARKAADGTAYPGQLATAGLAPWKTTKVLLATETPDPGSIRLEAARLATRLGRSLGDYTVAPRSLLVSQWTPSIPSVGYRLLACELPPNLASQDFFSGLVLSPDTDCRRITGYQAGGNLAALSKIAQKQRNLQALISRGSGTPTDNVGWLAQVDDLTRELGPDVGGEILYQLASQYRQSGQLALAADAFDLLVERFPAHPFTSDALCWLTLFYSSGEMDVHLRGETPNPAHYLAAPNPDAAGNTRVAERELAVSVTGEQITVSARPRPSVRRLAGTRADRALALGQYVRQYRPALFAEPAVQFSLAAVARQKSPARDVGPYETLARGALPPAWQNCARGEQWLIEGRGMPPKPTLTCVPATQAPWLDGKLDDEVWQQSPFVRLSSAQGDDEDWPAEVMLAGDQQFLFLGVRCRKAPGAAYPAAAGARTRDADLDGDRVELLIDVDRDYVSCYRLAIDHRGWTTDVCWGDNSWNPRWFVAVASDEQTWTAEAAIAWSELTGNTSDQGDAWALAIYRVVPGVGFQSWTPEASATAVLPQSFGYLKLP